MFNCFRFGSFAHGRGISPALCYVFWDGFCVNSSRFRLWHRARTSQSRCFKDFAKEKVGQVAERFDSHVGRFSALRITAMCKAGLRNRLSK